MAVYDSLPHPLDTDCAVYLFCIHGWYGTGDVCVRLSNRKGPLFIELFSLHPWTSVIYDSF